MGGRNCCVLNCRRRSHDHRGRKIPNGLTFHCFPAWRRQEGEQISRLTQRRRAAWVAAVAREDITFTHIPISTRICSRHFQSGKPAYEMLESDPDWVPTLHLGPAEGSTRRPQRLLQAAGRDRDQDQRRPAETRPPHETETETGGPSVRPWREVRPLLLSALQPETNFSTQRGEETGGGGAEVAERPDRSFRDFFRAALEASLEASSRSRTPSAPQPSSSSQELKEGNHTSSSSSCVNCVRLLRRNMELQEKLSRLSGEQDTEASPVHPDQDLQSPETAQEDQQYPAWMEPLSSPPHHEEDQDVDSAREGTREEPASKRKPRRTPRFQKAWLKMFWFLRYSPTQDVMWCQVCRLHSDPSRYSSSLIRGSRLFRFHCIKQHSLSTNHQDCVSRHLLQV